MTFCLAMKVDEGLVAIADTRITSGAEAITARKVTVQQHGRHSMFVMTSGLRSARDKALTYFDEVLEEQETTFDKVYKAVNALAEQVRRVAKEDEEALRSSNLLFNLHILIGGQLEADKEHKLYLLYPQANWVEVSRGTPYFVIGETGYGKPLLDRALRYDSSLEDALKIGFLAFDATRTSATDVYFPMDAVVYRRDSFHMNEHRFEHEELAPSAEWWNMELRSLIDQVPSDWVARAFPEVQPNVRSLPPRAEA